MYTPAGQNSSTGQVHVRDPNVPKLPEEGFGPTGYTGAEIEVFR